MNTFDEKMKRIEEIVSILEGGDVALERAMELFQEGASLIKENNALLDGARQQVTQLTVNGDGEPVLTEMELL